jgi:hypothetical protein
MKLTFKQKRLVREKAIDRFGDDYEIQSIHALRQKSMDEEETQIKIIVRKVGSDKDEYMFTRVKFLKERE